MRSKLYIQCVARASKSFWIYIGLLVIAIAVSGVFGWEDNGAGTLGLLATLGVIGRMHQKAGKTLFTGLPASFCPNAWRKIGVLFLFGITIALGLSCLLNLGAQWLPKLVADYQTHTQRLYQGWNLMLYALTTVVLTPLVEEVIFRGEMLTHLQTCFSPKMSIFLTTALFSLCHGNLLWMVYSALLGWLLAVVAIREEGVFPSIALHMGFNLSGSILMMCGQNIPFTLGLCIVSIGVSLWLLMWYFSK